MGWSSGLLVSDRWSWSDADGRAQDMSATSIPRGYEWRGGWRLFDPLKAGKTASRRAAADGGAAAEATTASRPSAWRYATNFPSRTSVYEGSPSPAVRHFVRWRRWVRDADRTTATPSHKGLSRSASESLGTAFDHFARGEADDTLPVYACCPVSFELFEDPVVTASGHTYERSIADQVLRADGRDPLTRHEIVGRPLAPDLALRRVVAAWKAYMETGDGSAVRRPDGAVMRQTSRESIAAALECRVDGFWQCAACTLVNSSVSDRCPACESPRGDARTLTLTQASELLTGCDSSGLADRGSAARAAASASDVTPAAAAPSGSPSLVASFARRAGGSVPDWLCCPLTGRLFADPVILPSGRSFERDALTLRWTAAGAAAAAGVAGADPATGEPVRHEDVYPHFALRAACEDWADRSACWTDRSDMADAEADLVAAMLGGESPTPEQEAEEEGWEIV